MDVFRGRRARLFGEVVITVYKPKGSRLYVYQFQYKGQRYNGPTGQAEKRAAQEVERTQRRAIETGCQPTAPNRLTLDEACARWFEERGKYAAKPQDVARALDLLLICYGAATLLSTLDAAAVSQAINTRRLILTPATPKRPGRPPGNATINRQIIDYTRAIHRRAQTHWGGVGFKAINWKDLALPVRKPGKHEVADDKLQAIFDQLDPHWQEFMSFLVTYGTRLGEAFFPPGDLWRGNDGRVRIKLADRKADDDHVIPVDEADAGAMLARKSRAEAAGLTTIWFTDQAGTVRPMTYSGAQSALRRAIARCNFPEPVRIHDLRHTAGTRITRQAGIRVAQKLLGHASITTTQRYAYASDEELAAAITASKFKHKG